MEIGVKDSKLAEEKYKKRNRLSLNVRYWNRRERQQAGRRQEKKKNGYRETLGIEIGVKDSKLAE